METCPSNLIYKVLANGTRKLDSRLPEGVDAHDVVAQAKARARLVTKYSATPDQAMEGLTGTYGDAKTSCIINYTNKILAGAKLTS